MNNPIKKWKKLNKQEKHLFINGCFIALKARCFISLFPVKKYASWIGVQKEYSAENTYHFQSENIPKIKLAIDTLLRIKKIIPFKLKCFEESIILKKILKKLSVDIILFLGLNLENDEKLNAHAWVGYSDKVIYGGKKEFNSVCIFT